MHTKFLEEVSKLIKLLMTNYTNLILLGDFNIHTQDIENQDLIAYIDMMKALGPQQHIDKPHTQMWKCIRPNINGKSGQSQSNPFLHR